MRRGKNSMKALFRYVLLDPLIAALQFLYAFITFHDLGAAIIVLTIIVRLILYPLFHKSLKQQTKLRVIQPQVKRIQETHKHDREAQGKALLALYKEHGVNPFGSFALLLVQLPILIALYQVFLYLPDGLNASFLGLINLHERSTIIVGIAAVLQYFLGVLSAGSGDPKDPVFQMARNMIVIGPLITVLVLYSLPSAVGLYWITTTVFSIIQQIYINKFYGTHTANHSKIIGDGRP